MKLDLDHSIPSFNKELNFNCYSFKKKFKLLGSAHNLQK